MKHGKILALVLCLLTALCLGAPALGETFAISSETTALFEGDTLQLEVTGAGQAESGEITWTSAAPKVASVDEKGLVTALSKGSCRITAACGAEGKTLSAVLNLQVLRRVTSVALNEQHLTLLSKDDPALEGVLKTPTDLPVLVIFRGAGVNLGFTVEPKDASNRQVVLTSGDESVVQVNGTGLRGLAAGECDVTASSAQNPEVSLSFRVLVAEKVSAVKVTAPAKALGAGTTLQLSASVTPENATIPKLVWSSSNENVATVDGNGLVTGLSRGTASIRAQAVDGSGRSAAFSVQVTQLPEEIQLSEPVTTVAVGYRKTVKATVLPASANDKKVTWTSSDESICTVNNTGALIPVKAGTCTLTCSSQASPQVQALCQVTVTQPITRITFAEKKTSVRVGEELQLKWTVEPEDVTDPSLVFTSNNQKVATVDENGVVHPVKRGQATITARANDGSRRTGSVIVEVIQPVTGVHMESDSFRVGVSERATLKVALEPADATNRNMTWTVEDEDIATISGTNNKPVVRGLRWGSTKVHGVTEDGGFTTECVLDVGNYNKALKITKVRVKGNEVKLSIKNLSNMTITAIRGRISVTDMNGGECPTTKDGESSFIYRYNHTVAEGESTQHGLFQFVNYRRPDEIIGSATVTITGYDTDTGFSWKVHNPDRYAVTWYDPEFNDESESRTDE